MNIYDIVKELYLVELRKREMFIKTAEYYKTESDIYYDCQLMAELSRESSQLAKEMTKKLQNTVTVSDKDIYSDDHQTGNDLGADLHFILIKTYLSKMNTNLASAYFHGHSYFENEQLSFAIQQNLDKQSEWLLNRLILEIENPMLKS